MRRYYRIFLLALIGLIVFCWLALINRVDRNFSEYVVYKIVFPFGAISPWVLLGAVALLILDIVWARVAKSK